MSSLRPILSPRSVAVVGVSSRPESLSGRLLDNLISRGFCGRILPVNPKASEIQGLPCIPSLAAAPEPVDLAILMVPRDAAFAAVDDCIAARVGGIVVITAGFREGGAEGARLERELVARVRGSGIRMVGPNCMGLINTDPGVGMDATFSPAAAMRGPIAFASHSGALGVAVLEQAGGAGLGFSQFVSVGNSADVNVADLLEHWEGHEPTRAVMLYLEAIEEPRRFLEVARRLTKRKPIIAFKSGRTEAGQRAASSHTGALAAADALVDALLRQAGVLRAATLAELFELAVAAQLRHYPTGRRVAVVTNAGGPAIAAMDALAGHGLEPARPGEATCAAIRAFLPAEATVGNPTDMLPSAREEDYGRAVGLVLDDPAVDAAVVIAVTPPLGTPLGVAQAIAAAAASRPKPVVTSFMTTPRFFAEAREVGGMPPAYRFPESAVRALAGLARHQARAMEPVEDAPPPALKVPSLARPHGPGYLSPGDAFTLLGEVGIRVAPWRLVAGEEEALRVAPEVGYPLVVKAVGPALVHKTEVGGVVLGIASAGALVAAIGDLRRRLEAAEIAVDGFLLQRQVGGGREVILGLTRDAALGPVVMCGLGGVAVEVWQDVAFRLAPITPGEAAAMVGELRGGKLLGAFRGRPAGDLAALRDALVRLAALGAAHPEVAECDVNPLLVLDEGDGCVAVDARVRLEPAPLGEPVPGSAR